MSSPRYLFKTAGLIFCLSLSTAARGNDQGSGGVVENRAPLQPNAFYPLALGAIEPRGWLREQLKIQAAGLTGHLAEFWSDVGPNSGWLGGTGESWERGPYYLDGLLPLAYELKDQKLIDQAKQWVDWTLEHQKANGQIGPASNDDWWPRMVMLKVLIQYQEASGDTRVISVMQKYFAYELRELPGRPLRDWGKYRWQDNVYSVLWLYNRTGRQDLLDLVRLLHKQGYDWAAGFNQFQFVSKQTRESLKLLPKSMPTEAAMQTHGVNNAMALKASPIWWLLTNDDGDKKGFGHQVAMLDKYHGLPNGMFSGDEHFAGPDPSQGIELCAVVEAMFSLEQAFGILGDARIADRLEKIAFNALPATLSNDIWSHQYDQQPNQIACTRANRQWSTNGLDSNLFGLQPNFGCCTANLHQGWPKFGSSLWMVTADGGLVTAVYAPSRVHTKLKDAEVTVDEQTDYPFRDTVELTIHVSQATEFPLIIRVPGWASTAKLRLNGAESVLPVYACEDRFTEAANSSPCEAKNALHWIKRTWNEGDRVQLSFQARPRVTHWFHDSTAFERGPLVFSLSLGGEWKLLQKYAEKSADWQVTSNVDWNYAVRIGECEAKSLDLPMSDIPFDPDHPSRVLTVQARQYPQWKTDENSAGPIPMSPVSSEKSLERLRLIPYGAAKLRITAFPYLYEKSTCGAAWRPEEN
jgi:hypothetical protein